MSDIPELLPCPFCGWGAPQKQDASECIWCPGCDTEGPVSDDPAGAWNIRADRLAAAEAERDEARRRRDEWQKKAEGYDEVRKALREKDMSRALWAGIAADEKKRADDAEAEIERKDNALREIAKFGTATADATVRRMSRIARGALTDTAIEGQKYDAAPSQRVSEADPCRKFCQAFADMTDRETRGHPVIKRLRSEARRALSAGED